MSSFFLSSPAIEILGSSFGNGDVLAGSEFMLTLKGGADGRFVADVDWISGIIRRFSRLFGGI